MNRAAICRLLWQRLSAPQAFWMWTWRNQSQSEVQPGARGPQRPVTELFNNINTLTKTIFPLNLYRLSLAPPITFSLRPAALTCALTGGGVRLSTGRCVRSGTAAPRVGGVWSSEALREKTSGATRSRTGVWTTQRHV